MTRVRIIVCLLAAALALAGCSSWQHVPPRPVDGPPLPAAWQGEALGRDVATTGTAVDFGDPLLARLVDEALRANLDLAQAGASLARARALQDLAAAGSRPSLGVGLSAGDSRSHAGSTRSWRAALDASWEADFFGARGAAVTAAQADAQAAESTLQATRLAVAAEVALSYVQWQGLRQQLTGARAALASQQQTAELVLARHSAGLSSDLERQQAELALAQAAARPPALELAATQTEHALALLLARPPADLRGWLAASPAAQPVAPALPLLPVPAELLRRRPDVQAAERKAAAALATLAQRQAERAPRLVLSGNLALQAATLAGLGGAGAWVAGLVAAVDWTPLDGGAGAAQVSAQQASVQAAQFAWQAAVLAALHDVEDSLSARAQQAVRVAALERVLTAARNSQELARQRWRSGLIDTSVLLDSEQATWSAADGLAGARVDLASSHIRLLKALGGGVTPTVGRPTSRNESASP